MKFEVEKRAFLNKPQLESLKDFLGEHGKLKQSIKRFTLVYMHRQNFVSDPDYPLDLKIRVTNGKGELALKYGDWHSGATREEYGVNFDNSQMEELLGMVKRLGHQWGIATYLHRDEYEYDDMIITVDDFEDYNTDLMEAEIVCNSKRDIQKSETKVSLFLKQRGLAEMKSDDMFKLVEGLNAREKWRFDFTKEDIKSFVAKWQKYINCEK